MKIKLLFFFIIFILINKASIAQNLPYIHKIVKDLGMPGMFGRAVFKNGDSIAADYVSKEFAKAKLKPISGNSFYQTFSIDNVVLESVSLEFGTKGNFLKPDDDYYICGFSPTSNIELNNAKTIVVNDPNH
jgi:hypothetical protein